MSFSNRKVVVTGIGLVTPLGIDVQSSWTNLINGISGIREIDRFDISSAPCKIAGLVSNSFNPENFIEPRSIKKMDLFIQYGIVAAKQAIKDSGYMPQNDEQSDRSAVVLGSGIGGLLTIEGTSIKSHQNLARVSPFFIPSALINLLSGHVAIEYKFSGPNHAPTTACATGTHAIGDAKWLIERGIADVVVAGGAEAPISPVGLAGFSSAKALATKYNDSPQQASRPWDENRDGFIMGEGAGVVVLEEYEHAKKRGAKIYAEIAGYGTTADAFHITSPHPEGRGAYRAMKDALTDAKINADLIDYINAHGTSTPVGDIIELMAVQRLFAASKDKILMSSTKSSTGHLLGAAGSVEVIFSILAMNNSILPATLNLDNPAKEAEIDLIAKTPREKKIDYILSNSFGFGGTNASLVIKKI